MCTQVDVRNVSAYNAVFIYFVIANTEPRLSLIYDSRSGSVYFAECDDLGLLFLLLFTP